MRYLLKGTAITNTACSSRKDSKSKKTTTKTAFINSIEKMFSKFLYKLNLQSINYAQQGLTLIKSSLSKKRMKILAFILLTISTQNNAFAGFTFIADAGSKHCQVKGASKQVCEADEQCSISLQVCQITLNTLSGTIEAESIKEITRFIGQAIIYVNKTVVKLGIKTSRVNMLSRIGNAFKYNSGVRKIKGLSSSVLLEYSIDLVFSIAADLYVDQLTESQINNVRKLPISGFSNAPTKVIKTSLKRLIQIAKNNFKFLIFKTNHPIIAARSAIVDNSLILAEISVDVAKSAVEAIDSSLAASMSEKRGQILDIYAENSSLYFKSADKHEKLRIKLQAADKCDLIKFDGFERFFASLQRDKYSLENLNSALTSFCWHNELNMLKEDGTKYSFIRLASTFSKDRYEKYIQYYFPSSEHYSLLKLYEIENFDTELRLSKNLAAHNKIKKALAHGLTIEDLLMGDSLFKQEVEIKKNDAYNLVLLSIWTQGISDETLPFLYDEYVKSDVNYLITRKEFSELINIAFKLDKYISQERVNKLKLQSAVFKQAGKDWPYDALVLKELNIIKSASPTFKSNELITKYEMLVILVNTMDYYQCGYVGCKVANIVGVAQ